MTDRTRKAPPVGQWASTPHSASNGRGGDGRRRPSRRADKLGGSPLIGIGSMPQRHPGGHKGSCSPLHALPRGISIVNKPRARSPFTLPFRRVAPVDPECWPCVITSWGATPRVTLAYQLDADNTLAGIPRRYRGDRQLRSLTADGRRDVALHARRCVYYPTKSILSTENRLLTVSTLGPCGHKGWFAVASRPTLG